jgi:hypothetical protein
MKRSISKIGRVTIMIERKRGVRRRGGERGGRWCGYVSGGGGREREANSAKKLIQWVVTEGIFTCEPVDDRRGFLG